MARVRGGGRRPVSPAEGPNPWDSCGGNAEGPIAHAAGFDASRVEVALEVGADGGELGRGVHGLETRRAVEQLAHALGVPRIVRPEVNDAAGLQRAPGDPDEVFVDQAVLVVPPLRPRIREVDMEGAHAARGKEVFDAVGGLDAEAPHVEQASALGLAVELAYAPEQPFDPEEVAVRVPRSPLDQERTVAAPELDLERRGPPEGGREVERLEP